ncbi:MAG: hypothetical protein Q8N84_00005, partial [bacterium]|nr:hypothetical protein [bacterium]
SELVGGVKGALDKRLGVGWRGEGSKELMGFVNSQLPEGSRVKVIIDSEGYPPLDKKLVSVGRGEIADYIVCLPPQIEEVKGNSSLQTIYAVKAGGLATLAEVYFDPTAKGK